jgi:hypothetical protein
MRIKPRIVLAGSVPQSDYWPATLIEPECAIESFLSLPDGVFSMNRASATRRIARIGFAPVLLSLAAGFGTGNVQTAPATLNAVDWPDERGLRRMAERLRRCQNDDSAARSTHPPLQ